MNSIKEHLTESYSQVDDFFQTHPQLQRQRRSHNHPPIFTDNEVMALGLMQGYFRTADLKRVFLLVLANDARAFSAPITYQQWLHRLHALRSRLRRAGRSAHLGRGGPPIASALRPLNASCWPTCSRAESAGEVATCGCDCPRRLRMPAPRSSGATCRACGRTLGSCWRAGRSRDRRGARRRSVPRLRMPRRACRSRWPTH